MKIPWKLALLTVVATIAMPLSAATAADLYGQWPMDTSGNVVPNTTGQANMTLSGPGWESSTGAVGGAVRFYAATSYGFAPGSESANPGTGDFAMGVTFTSDPIPEGTSGNIMQKGLANTQGQVKISLSPTLGGRTFCRVKGTNGYRILKSKVVVDDGQWHTAICWREGTTIGLTVDGVTVALLFDPGSVATTLPVRIGNKSATAGYTDQHFGKTDCAVWALGSGARAQAAMSTPC